MVTLHRNCPLKSGMQSKASPLQTTLTLEKRFAGGQNRLFQNKCHLPKFYFQTIYWNHRSMLKILQVCSSELIMCLQIPGSFTIIAAEASKPRANLTQTCNRDKTDSPRLNSRSALLLFLKDTYFFSKQASRTNKKKHMGDFFRGMSMDGMLQHKY